MKAEVRFGVEDSEITINETGFQVSVAASVLFGKPGQLLYGSDTFVRRRHGSFVLLQDENTLVGAACVTVDQPLESVADLAYKNLLDSLEGYHLLRVWNYVPNINESIGDLENYKSFCIGRSNQFTSHQLSMSSASAVGITGKNLVIYFLAVKEPVRHWENPEQVPAYRYPSRYGPKSPSFSRASEVVCSTGYAPIYVSGTASIKGHESKHIGNLHKQLTTTLDNIRIIKEATLGTRGCCGASILFDETCIYLRKQKHLDELLELWNQEGFSTDTLRILKSDICRANLLIEIETQRPILPLGQE